MVMRVYSRKNHYTGNNIYQRVLVIMVVFGYSEQICTFEELPRINYLCTANITCSTSTKNFDVQPWQCIRHKKSDYRYSYYDYDKVVIDSDYVLYVEVNDVNIENTVDPLIGISPYGSKVRKLVIKNGNLVEFHPQILNMNKLEELSIVANELENINLDSLAKLTGLKMINFSQNAISVIEQDNGRYQRSLSEEIDLSYNLLIKIPDNCFGFYPNLKFLDLSHNLLSTFDILSFEGIANLQILHLSHNQIVELGQNLARFTNLKEITLNSNHLTNLNKINFKSLVCLEILDLSYNSIKDFDNDTFSYLIKLNKIDLSYNKMSRVRNKLFKNNKNLSTVSLANNFIEQIEGGTFEHQKIIDFSVVNNSFTGSIENDTFAGIQVIDLNLSGGKISHLGNKAFSILGVQLQTLNLSMNLIQNISKSTFRGLYHVVKLDISYNLISNLDFDTVDLEQVSDFNLCHNKIKVITRDIFTNIKELKKIDLSFNQIDSIGIGSFSNLTKLETLILNNNIFEKSLAPKIFENLINLQYLNLMNTKLLNYENNSLIGLPSIKYLNSSIGGLISIEYEIFNGCGAIEIIDFSFNQIQSFSINTTHIPSLTELYLNNNNLTNITDRTFINLRKLKIINLSFNNILKISSMAFQPLEKLNTIDLSMNNGIKMEGTVFNNLIELSEISLARTGPIKFSGAYNSSMKTLSLSFCDIIDLSSVDISKIPTILKLDLSLNKIMALNKESFQDMPVLEWIIISSNYISHIQPGTFLHTNMVNILDLHNNKITYLQYGALDGLTNLRVLNLSHNALNNFDANILHVAPHITKLFLDNNNITNIQIMYFAKTSIQILSIGNNPLTCDVINFFKTLEVNFKLTAEVYNYHSENINGISCITVDHRGGNLIENKHDNISSYVSELINSQEKLNNILSTFLNSTPTNSLDNTRNELYYNFTNEIINIFNNTQVATAKYINQLSNKGDNSLGYFLNVTSNINALQNTLSNAVKNQKEEYEGMSEIIKSILQKIDRNKGDIMIVPRNMSYNNTEDIRYIIVKDDKTLVHLLSAVLGIFVLVIILNIAYKYYLRTKETTTGPNIIMEMQ